MTARKGIKMERPDFSGRSVFLFISNQKLYACMASEKDILPSRM